MNKTELIAAVAEKAEISKKDAEGAVNAMIDTIIEAVALEDKVQIVGFGTFECRTRNEKLGEKRKNWRRYYHPSIQGSCFQGW